MALFSSNKEKRENEDKLSKQFSVNNEENVNGISTISMETTITGTIESNSVFKMEGVLNGDINGNKIVHVGKTGKVNGNDKVEIGNTGKVYATITSAVFVIQEGGLFEGTKKIKVALIKEKETKPKAFDKEKLEKKENKEL